MLSGAFGMAVELNVLAAVGKCFFFTPPFSLPSPGLRAAVREEKQRSRVTSFVPSILFPLLPVLSMPSSNQGWPEDFGFQLGGHGPSYILSVEEGSSAHLAGLQAGDQVLEIEGHNVSTLGPQAVISIAQTQKNIPPSIGVVSRIQQVQQLFSQMHVVICVSVEIQNFFTLFSKYFSYFILSAKFRSAILDYRDRP